MTTRTQPAGEWAAPPLRPTARWVPVCGADGRTRLEMVWAPPEVDVAALANEATGTGTAA